MDASIAAHALARASATLTDQHDVPGALTTLLRSCKDTLGVDAAGILVSTGDRLELLAASSHTASELEIHQAQLDEGPCVEAHSTGAPVQAAGGDVLSTRWPAFAPVMLDAGFQSVHASPLNWRRTAIGAMGLFSRSPEPFTADDDVFAQAFADIATLLIVSTDDVSSEALAEKLRDVLKSRIVIEQAKGVLAEQHGLTMAEAYDLLVLSATDKRVPLSQWAIQLLRDAHGSAGTTDERPLA